MCELLILAKDSGNPDPKLDRFAYKAGHVIAIQPDGHKWGRLECTPRFWIIKLPNIDASEVEEFLSCKYSPAAEDAAIAIREWKFDPTQLGVVAGPDLAQFSSATINDLKRFKQAMKPA